MLSDGFFHHIIINFFVCLTQNRFSFSSRVRLVRFQQPCRFSSPPRTHRLHLVGSPRVNRACPPGEEANPFAEDPSEDYNGVLYTPQSPQVMWGLAMGHNSSCGGPVQDSSSFIFSHPQETDGHPSCRYVEIATQVAITWQGRVKEISRGRAREKRGGRRKREPAQAATKRQRDKKRATQDRR